ncbi:MAG: hypothetical protein FGM52_15000, partial [Mycobacterium sp.]|nr:hypothetical protein [Mycobacterium sp.]
MTASTYIGRIGVLAATLGVGAALFGGSGIAAADPTAPDTAASDSAATASPGAQTSTPSRGRGPSNRNARGGRAASEAAPQQSSAAAGADLKAPGAAEAQLPPVVQRDDARRASDSAEAAAAQRALAPTPAAVEATARAAGDSVAIPTRTLDSSPLPAATVAPAPAAALTAPITPQAVSSLIETAKKAVATSQTVGTQAVRPGVGVPAIVANVANRISTVVNSVVSRLVNSFLGNSPLLPRADGPASWLMLAAARRQPLAAATGAAQVSAPAGPTLLVLNGYNVVSDSIEEVTAFTGRFTYWPGMPNMLQGRQELKLVDPATKQSVGSFEALVTSGDPTSIGGRYVQLLVTDNDGTNVGTGAGQIPPVGSMISTLSLGLFGLSYSAMPSPSGDKVSVKLKTLFGDIALPFTYDASKGIADRTFDNRPMELGGGFSIAPADPFAEKITATIGLLPLFNSVQGRQLFSVYDSAGKSVGSFEG